MGLVAGSHCGGALFLEGWSVRQLFVPDPGKNCVEFAVLGLTRKPQALQVRGISPLPQRARQG